MDLLATPERRRGTTKKSSQYSEVSFSSFSAPKDSTDNARSYKSEFSFSFYIDSEPNLFRKFSPKIIISADTTPIKADRKKVTLNRADCIRKRIKTHFNQYLLKVINRSISRKFPKLSLSKLSQQFIADVKIESNKKYIDLPIKEVLTEEFKGSRSHLDNQQIINTIFESSEEELKQLLKLPYSEYFALYIKSDHYINDLKKFAKKEGEGYSSLYKKLCHELIEYYKNGVPYKRKRLSTFDSYQ